jgi:hypothetical protein
MTEFRSQGHLAGGFVGAALKQLLEIPRVTIMVLKRNSYRFRDTCRPRRAFIQVMA